MDLSIRNTEIELMDKPELEAALLREVFKDINRVNKMLGGNKITIEAVWELIVSDIDKTYAITDLGCGDGAMLREIATFLRKKGVTCELKGIEIRNDVLTIARIASQDYPEIIYEQGDILDPKLYEDTCDILLCTLTLHHFKDAQIPKILEGFSRMAKTAVVLNDLHRSNLSYYLFSIFSLFFIRTKIGKLDGITSIKSGFKKNELIALSAQMPNFDHRIHWKWAFRYLWIMNPPRII